MGGGERDGDTIKRKKALRSSSLVFRCIFLMHFLSSRLRLVLQNSFALATSKQSAICIRGAINRFECKFYFVLNKNTTNLTLHKVIGFAVFTALGSCHSEGGLF